MSRFSPCPVCLRVDRGGLFCGRSCCRLGLAAWCRLGLVVRSGPPPLASNDPADKPHKVRPSALGEAPLLDVVLATGLSFTVTGC